MFFKKISIIYYISKLVSLDTKKDNYSFTLYSDNANIREGTYLQLLIALFHMYLS